MAPAAIESVFALFAGRAFRALADGRYGLPIALVAVGVVLILLRAAILPGAIASEALR
jgi:hypothetical protein